MNMNSIEVMPAAPRRQVVETVSADTRRVLILGRNNGWRFHLLGLAEMPEEMVRIGDWMIVPAIEDSSPILRRTYERIQAIYADGVRPKGFVVVHEAPKLLATPQGAKLKPNRGGELWEKIRSNLTPAKAAMGIAAVGTAAVAGAAAMAVILAAMAAAVTLPVLFLGALAIDPIVVAVMEDGSWIEIDRWSVEFE